MFLRNCWYVAAWQHELDTSQLLARTLLNEPIVMYQHPTKGPVALADQCCHRLAPLSRGRIEDGNLRCMYHGLLFNPDGKCIEIPGQTLIPPKAIVRHYPVVVRNKLVWIWMGDPARGDAALIPDTYALDHPAWRYRPGYLHYRANYQNIVDNVLDFSHLSYVHSQTLGGTDLIARSKPIVEAFDRGVRIKRYMVDGAQPPFSKRFADMRGNVDRWHFYELLVPGNMLMESGIQPTGTGMRDGRHENSLQFRAYNLMTPETDTTTHYFFALAHGFGLDDPSVTDGVYDEVLKAFKEDGAMIEAQQQVIDRLKSPQMVVIAADAGLMQMRRIMDRLIAAENEGVAQAR
jgi:phenylpropionate dioxygenase-like ring-hydroxylating dioxygenase large terminal subunit